MHLAGDLDGKHGCLSWSIKNGNIFIRKVLGDWIEATDFRICKHQSSKPNSVPVSRVEVIPWFF